MKSFVLFTCLLPQVFGSIVDDLNNQGLTKLVELVEKVGLVDNLLASEPLTVFAPTNKAFNNSSVFISDDVLKKTLLYHVIPQMAISSNMLLPDNKYLTASGSPLTVNAYNNGVVTANGKKVSKANVKVGMGSIAHEIDEVIPFINLFDDIPAVLTREGMFKTLILAVGKADLADKFGDQDVSLTVFAPTDEAFAKLPADAIKDLLKPENKNKLVALLTAHVLPNALYSAGIENGKEYQTVNGDEKLMTEVSDDGVVIKRMTSGTTAMVEKADIATTNGVIHSIDTVLL